MTDDTSRLAHKIPCTPDPFSSSPVANLEPQVRNGSIWRQRSQDCWVTAWGRCPNWKICIGYQVREKLLLCQATEIWVLFTTTSIIYLTPWKLLFCSGLFGWQKIGGYFLSSWAREGEETACWVTGHLRDVVTNHSTKGSPAETWKADPITIGGVLENGMLETCFNWTWLCLGRQFKEEMSSGNSWLFLSRKWKVIESPEIQELVRLQKVTVSSPQTVRYGNKM